MDSEVKLEQFAPRQIAFRRGMGRYGQIPEAIGELFAWLEPRGLRSTGAIGARYYDDPATAADAAVEWEVFTELAAPEDTETYGADGAGRVESSPFGVRRQPGGEFAVSVHQGPYDTLGAAYELLRTWVCEHGFKLVGPPEEIYLSEPSVPPDSTKTEIRFPVAPIG